MGKLVLFLADGTARDIKLDRDRVTIGRRQDNDICIPQPAVSGEHAAVVTILSDSFLEDLGSTNGTQVNGKPVAKHFLRDRDEIDVGRQVLVYLVDDNARLEARPLERPENPAADANLSPKVAEPLVDQGAQYDKRRSDGLMAISGHSVDALQRVVAEEIESGVSETFLPVSGAAEAAPEVPLPGPSAEPMPMMKVLTGSSAGRVVSLGASETLLGRAGVQVAALRRSADEIRVIPVEGAKPPSVNGTPVAPEGQRLEAGDILEIAGARLELVVPLDATSETRLDTDAATVSSESNGMSRRSGIP